MANILFKMVNLKKDAHQILASGQACDKFQEICEAQGGDIHTIPIAPFQHTIHADESKMVRSIRNQDIVAIAKLAGAPQHVEAGVYLHAHVGDNVKKGAPLMTIHARTQDNLGKALAYAMRNGGNCW